MSEYNSIFYLDVGKGRRWIRCRREFRFHVAGRLLDWFALQTASSLGCCRRHCRRIRYFRDNEVHDRSEDKNHQCAESQPKREAGRHW